MSYKIGHYAAKTVKTGYQLDIETLSIELVIGAICLVMGIAGYSAKMALIFKSPFAK